MKGRRIKFENPKVLQHESLVWRQQLKLKLKHTKSRKRFAFSSIEIVSNPQNIHVHQRAYIHTHLIHRLAPEFSSFSNKLWQPTKNTIAKLSPG